MKSLKICSMVFIMLLYANTIFAAGHGLINGGFEADGHRILNISIPGDEPNGWDVNVPTSQFTGAVDDFWKSEGNFSLTLSSKAYQIFEANDIAFVYQQVTLSDVNQIFFDVHLDTSGDVWNPALRSAVVMIDGIVVWESPKTGTDIRGVFLHQVINLHYQDNMLHEFAIGIRADANEMGTNIEYYTDWDNIGFDLLCNGMGFGGGDFNLDCRVDINDFCTLADLWMGEVELDSIYNLSPIEDSHQQQGIVNFCDYALWAQLWDPNDANDVNDVNQLEQLTSIWLSEVPSDSAWNLYKGDDSHGHGIINADDLVIFVENWLRGVLP